MIKVNDLISLFERMAEENWDYRWGGAKAGEVDCSGAFVYAYNLLNGPEIEHSSNWLARRAVGNLCPASMAQPGWAVFRHRYTEDMPERWKKDGMGDYYHVGLMGTDGCVLNARGEAKDFGRSYLSGWSYAAPLLDVDYDKEDEPMLYRAEVITETDDLRVRNAPETGQIIGHAPKGCTVDVLDCTNAAWPRIRYGSLVGYSSAQYLKNLDTVPEEDSTETPEDDGQQPASTTLVRIDGEAISITLEGLWRLAMD